MCDTCRNSARDVARDVSSFLDTLRTGSPEAWEISELLTWGGPTGNAIAKSPFIGPCEYSVISAFSSGSAGLMVISASPTSSDLGLVAGSTLLTENLNIDGIALRLPAEQTVPILTPFAPMKNVENNLYLRITSTGVIYVTLQFRQKRRSR